MIDDKLRNMSKRGLQAEIDRWWRAVMEYAPHARSAMDRTYNAMHELYRRIRMHSDKFPESSEEVDAPSESLPCISEEHLQKVEGDIIRLRTQNTTGVAHWPDVTHHVYGDMLELMREIRKMKIQLRESRVCPSCGVYEGEVHVWNCDMEICPFCNLLLTDNFCECEVKQFKLSVFENYTKEQEKKWRNALTEKGRIPWTHAD